MKNRIKFYKFVKVASKVLIGILIALAVVLVSALIFRACAPAENNIAYASEADGVGTWVWNFSSGAIPFEDGNYSVDFSSSDGANVFSYSVISVAGAGTPFAYIAYDSQDVYYAGSGWVNDGFKTIDIKTAPPAEFLTILQAHATYQGGTTPEPDVTGYYKWNNNLVDFASMNGKYSVDITANGENFNQIEFQDNGAIDQIFYQQVTNGNITKVERAYLHDDVQPNAYGWTTGYQTFRLNVTPEAKLLNYIQSNATYISNAEYMLSGKINLNSILNYGGTNTASFEQTIDFSTYDETTIRWSGIIWENAGDDTFNLYYRNKNTNNQIKVWSETDGWVSTIYKFLNFGETSVNVSQQFFEWIQENRIEETGFTLDGKYIFLNNLNYPITEEIEQNVNFTTENGNKYYAIEWQTNNNAYNLLYARVENRGYFNTVYSSVGNPPNTPPSGWRDTEYQTIDFGTVPQIVSQDFYNFVQNTAVSNIDTNDPLYQKGYEQGKKDGIAQGLEDAKDIVTPNSASWNAGYDKGLADAADNTLLDGPKAIFRSVVDILNINIFGIPGFTVGAIVAIVVALGVLLFILKIIRG